MYQIGRNIFRIQSIDLKKYIINIEQPFSLLNKFLIKIHFFVVLELFAKNFIILYFTVFEFYLQYMYIYILRAICNFFEFI